ncbi:phage minor capsid protein [Microbacterium allomyrinae]|uniref:Minor capsid protein n=1 Tax=Microbacterium allomyrinae TaxID=2830666 RepID=A0A9X1S4J9_9MICO|nr:phage minor capsid protein [Microbacterium allomyrinae]MCC2033075.1 hypothetical protein [Microbacterium allomyrinae]
MADRTAEQLTAALVAAYVLAEQRLLAGSTSILKRTPLTNEGAFTALGQMRRLVRRILASLAGGDQVAAAMITTSSSEGRRAAEAAVTTAKSLARINTPADARGGPRGPGGGRPPGRGLDSPGPEPFDLSMPHGERAAQAIRDDVVSSLADVRHRITRLPDDIYKMIAPHGAIYQVIDNNITPQQAQAMAWRVFVSQGVTGFTDVSGREWSLSAYVEMAVRTASTRAFNDSHLSRMRALGIEYFSVPDSGHPCPKCFPWQGKVLTAVRIENPTIPVDGTIAEAVAAGLFHPNCRHTLTAVFPGITVLPEARVWTAEEQRLYDLSQTQRRLELEVRKAKRQLEYAITPEARAAAQAKVRRGQAKIREFVRVTGFARQSRREQVDLTDAHIKLPTPIR